MCGWESAGGMNGKIEQKIVCKYRKNVKNDYKNADNWLT